MTERIFRIPRLKSGGLITTYRCVAQCGHCLYNCGPHRKPDYIGYDKAGELFEQVRALGCPAMHIGGGEPGIDMDKLGAVLDAAGQTGMHIEYVETNAFWYVNEEKGRDRLRFLKSRGLGALLISISPFHNAFVPYARAVGLMRACRDEGIGVIPWVAAFNPLLSKLDQAKTHNWVELEKALGANLKDHVRRNYWLHPGGRALDFFRKSDPGHSVEEILGNDRYGCEVALADTGHFHVDLSGRYVPGLCSGLSVDMQDVAAALDGVRYPLMTLLMSKGIKGLFELASAEHGYRPARELFLNKCDLCHDIRKHLVQSGWSGSWELSPRGHYLNPPV